MSPLGLAPHLGKLVWAWSPYLKAGLNGALASKWTGPWKVTKFSLPALTLIQTTWRHQIGKAEQEREVVLDKLKPFIQSNDDILGGNLDAGDKLLLQDPDKGGTDPCVDEDEAEN